MKGMEIEVMIAIFVLVIVMIITVLWGGDFLKRLFGLSYSEAVNQEKLKAQEDELRLLYKNYNSDGGLDAYEASILLAKAIEYTWEDCYNSCKDERELFTNFFYENPINFNKKTDCDKAWPSGYTPNYPNINKLKYANLCYNNKDEINEWTVTAWGLATDWTNMCSLKFGDNVWGNACDTKDPQDLDKHPCDSFCNKGGKGLDLLDWQADKMSINKIYRTIRIAYKPESGVIFKDKPKIIVKEISESGFDFSLSLNPASSSVAKGSSATATVSATLVGGGAQTVVLSCFNMPPDITCSFNPSSITPTAAGATSTLTIKTSLTTPARTYPITVKGTSDSLTASKAFAFIVLS